MNKHDSFVRSVAIITNDSLSLLAVIWLSLARVEDTVIINWCDSLSHPASMIGNDTLFFVVSIKRMTRSLYLLLSALLGSIEHRAVNITYTAFIFITHFLPMYWFATLIRYLCLCLTHLLQEYLFRHKVHLMVLLLLHYLICLTTVYLSTGEAH